EASPRVDFAGAAPSANWLQPCGPVTGANGAIGYGVCNAIQRQPGNPGAVQRGSLMLGSRRPWAVAIATATTAVWLSLSPLTAAAADARTQLKAFVSQVNSATGKFTQTTTGPQGGAQRAQSGDFAFQRPGKFKWAVSQPYEQLVISHGQQLFQYDPDLAQVTTRQVDQAIGTSPAAIL